MKGQFNYYLFLFSFLFKWWCNIKIIIITSIHSTITILPIEGISSCWNLSRTYGRSLLESLLIELYLNSCRAVELYQVMGLHFSASLLSKEIVDLLPQIVLLFAAKSHFYLELIGVNSSKEAHQQPSQVVHSQVTTYQQSKVSYNPP